MRGILYLCLGFASLWPKTGFASRGGSGLVGDGGNTVLCRTPAAPNGAEYSLDFVATAWVRSGELAAVESVDASLARISDLLMQNRRTLPYLQFSLDAFRANLFNTSDDSQYNFWEPETGGLDLTHDQKLERPLPASCLEGGELKLHQAFQRFGSRFTGSGTETTVYHYVPAIVEQLKANPVQLSFLLLHEWLWNVSSDVQVNRRVNFFLHSKAIEHMNYNEVRQALVDMGFDFSRMGLRQDETEIQSFAEETPSGTGTTRATACLVPRREYAKEQQWLYANQCAPKAANTRLATINYTEHLINTDPQTFMCTVYCTFVCLSSP